MPAPALLDATPLSDGHAARGIGTAVRGMIDALAARPRDERPALLMRRGQRAPPGFAIRRWRGRAGRCTGSPTPGPRRSASALRGGSRRAASSTRSSPPWSRPGRRS